MNPNFELDVTEAGDALVTAVVAGPDDVKKQRRISKPRTAALSPAATYPIRAEQPLRPLETPPDLHRLCGKSPLATTAVMVAETYRIPLAEALVLLWHAVASVAVTDVVIGDTLIRPWLHTAIRIAAPCAFGRAATAITGLLPKAAESLLLVAQDRTATISTLSVATRYALWFGDDLAMAPAGFRPYPLGQVVTGGGPVVLPKRVKESLAQVRPQELRVDSADLLDGLADATRACKGQEAEFITLLGAMMALAAKGAAAPMPLDVDAIAEASSLLQALHAEQAYHDDHAAWRGERTAAIELCEWLERNVVREGCAAVWPSTSDIQQRGPRSSGCRRPIEGSRLLEKMQNAGWVSIHASGRVQTVSVHPELFIEIKRGAL